MTRVAWWFFVALLVPVPTLAEAPGELPADALVERTIDAGGMPLHLRLVRPVANDDTDDASDLFPLVLVPAPPSQGAPRSGAWSTFSMGVLVSADARSRYPAFVAEISFGGDEVRSDGGHGEGAGSERRVAALAAAVDELAGAHAVDRDRVVVVGEGEGADLAWRLLARTPGRYAAGVFIGGQLDPQLAGRLVATPLWIYHGVADGQGPVERARAAVSAVWAAGGTRARYTEVRGSRPVWVPAWREDRLLPWLFSQRRE